MMRRSCSSREPVRSGFSLIEVITATVLAGTLLAATLAASRQHSRQAKAAQAKQAAVDALDRLLERWSAVDGTRLSGSGGAVPGTPILRWSRRVVERNSTERPFQVVRVAIHTADAQGPPLAVVDLMEPP